MTDRKSSQEFPQELWRLFDRYVHGDMDRRAFLGHLQTFAVGGLTGMALFEALSPHYAWAIQVPETDKRIKTEEVSMPSPNGNGTIKGHLAMPAKKGKFPAVLVVHENRGLNPHIEDVARRLALAGYRAFAPDALFTLGGYPGDEDSARALFPQLDQAKCREDFVAASRWLLALEGGNGRLGATGFCYGGAIVNLLATRLPELAAAAPYYGGAAPLEGVPDIKAELLVVLAADDERVNATWPPYEAALTAAGTRFALFQPEGTLHGFHNDTTPRYSEAAAREAWAKTLALFERALRG